MARPRISVDRIRASAFSLTDDLPIMRGEPHRHGKHQLLYAASGTMVLELDDASWFLPSSRAAWIGAGTVHRVVVTSACRLSTIYFSQRLVREYLRCQPPRCTVFQVTAFAREMILGAERWGPTRAANDARANRFFRVLVDDLDDWLTAEEPFVLPRAKSPELARAMTYAHENLALATVIGAARAAGMSTRTLARRFRDDVGWTWRHFLYTARMIRAMDQLGRGSRRVTDVAIDLGFDSLSAFSSAFRRFTGQSPRDFSKTIAGSATRAASS